MNNQEKKVKLIEVDGFKKHFELKKTKLLAPAPVLRANDGLTLDIIQGETLGLVGESGCGKSTFGRVLLQLYDQTQGSTIYNGFTIAQINPGYVKKQLQSIKKHKEKIATLTEKGILQPTESEESLIRKKQMYADEAISQYHKLSRLLGGAICLDGDNLEAAAKARLNLFQAEVSFASLLKNGKEDKAALNMAELKVETTKAEFNKIKNSAENLPGFIEAEAFFSSGVDLSELTPHELRPLRKDIQIIFQDPYSSLNPRMSVGQIISEGLTAHGMFKRGSDELDKYVKAIMVKCGLAEYFIHRYPHQFSGGQRQRIGIARALTLNPKFIVCDEAVSALDVSIQSQIINLLLDLKEEQDLTYLFITHNLSVVKYISDRIGVMYLGNMCELAPSKNIFEKPLHPYTQALLSVIPSTEEVKKGRIPTLEGDIPSPVNPPIGCKFCTRCPKVMDKCMKVAPKWQEYEPGHFVACHLYETDEDR